MNPMQPFDARKICSAKSNIVGQEPALKDYIVGYNVRKILAVSFKYLFNVFRMLLEILADFSSQVIIVKSKYRQDIKHIDSLFFQFFFPFESLEADEGRFIAILLQHYELVVDYGAVRI